MSGNGSKLSGFETDGPGGQLATAVRLLIAGKARDAIGALHQVLAADPQNTDALHMLGVIACKAGDLDAGISILNRTVELAPGDAGAHYNLGNAYSAKGLYEEAADSLRRAVELTPDNGRACHLLANALVNLRAPEEAVTYYERAVRADADNTDAAVRLALLYEQHNRPDEALELAERVLEKEPDEYRASLVLARCEKRKGKIESAIARLEKILNAAGQDNVDFRLYYELGRLHDRDGNVDEAFRNFSRGNEQQKQIWASREQEGPVSADYIRWQLDAFTREWVAGWSETPPVPDGQTPVFLIGFPRSGTTLLDQILDGHPRFRVLEEKPTVAAMLECVSSLADGFPRAMAALTTNQIEDLREIYFQSAARYIELEEHETLVDKLPLNTPRAGLIHRVFPQARFVFALRHPHDVILSCYMQDFQLNPAMASFLDLETAADFYTSTMTLWNRFTDLLPLNVHYVRYESLVQDLEAESRQLLDFLGAEFDERVLSFAEHARSRDRINTPSYHQVSQPIYTSAVDRWKRYKTYLQPTFDKLRPFVEQFGYEKS